MLDVVKTEGPAQDVRALAARLVALMEARGWSQSRLEEKSGVPQGTISRLKRATIAKPKHADLQALADAFGVPVDALTGKAPVPADVLVAGEVVPYAVGASSPSVVREHVAAYGDTEAPTLANLPNWNELVQTAMGLDEARNVPAWAFELLGYSNGLLTVPLVPAAVVSMAKTIAGFITPAEAEKALAALRSKR